MNLPGGWELVLILVVAVLLFGAKRLPDAARSAGRSLRIFKSEVKGMADDERGTTIDVEPSTAPDSAAGRDATTPARDKR